MMDVSKIDLTKKPYRGILTLISSELGESVQTTRHKFLSRDQTVVNRFLKIAEQRITDQEIINKKMADIKSRALSAFG